MAPADVAQHERGGRIFFDLCHNPRAMSEASDKVRGMRELPLFPLPVVLFPGVPLPLHIFEPRYRQMLTDIRVSNNLFGLSYFDPTIASTEVPPSGHIGCVAEVTETQTFPDGRSNILTLGVIRYALGDLDRVQQAVQMLGFVNSSPTFSDQPRVINGATDLLVELYGDRGKPTRAAIGCRGLALNHSVEVVLTVLFAGSEVRPPLHRDAR